MGTTEKSRGRPRTFDPDAAVDTAMRLFHRKGYDAVGVAELTEALGIRPPSFYAAFGSKAGLFRRALDRYSASESNLLLAAEPGGGDVATVVERMFRIATRLYVDCDGATGCLVIEGARDSIDAEARAVAAEAKAAANALLTAFIARDYPEQAERLARYVAATLAGMSAMARDGAGQDALADVAGIAARAFRREAGQPG